MRLFRYLLSGQVHQQLPDGGPGFAGFCTFDDAVDAGAFLQGGDEARGGDAAHGQGGELLFAAPQAQAVAHLGYGLPLFEGGGEADEGADVVSQHPQQHHRLFAVGFEAFEQAHHAGGLAAHPGGSELEYVETGYVGHGGFGFGNAQFVAGGVEQGEFVDFLLGSQEVAFHALGKQGQRFVADG